MCIWCVFLLKHTHQMCIIKERESDDMKQRKLVKMLEAAGFVFYRHGGSHDIYIKDGKIEQIPRHKEINEQLAKAIIKKWGL